MKTPVYVKDARYESTFRVIKGTVLFDEKGISGLIVSTNIKNLRLVNSAVHEDGFPTKKKYSLFFDHRDVHAYFEEGDIIQIKHGFGILEVKQCFLKSVSCTWKGSLRPACWFQEKKEYDVIVYKTIFEIA